jgi:hypothetical protein
MPGFHGDVTYSHFNETRNEDSFGLTPRNL